LKGILKRLEGQKIAHGQWVGHPWFIGTISIEKSTFIKNYSIKKIEESTHFVFH
jgi:hypothetical protein